MCIFAFKYKLQEFNDSVRCDDSLAVRIAAFQAVDPGSSPGRRTLFYFFYKFSIFNLIKF